MPDWWIALGLAAAVFAVYAQTRGFPFIGFDDPEFVVNNLNIRSGLTLASLKWAFTTGYAANWFPLTWISYMLGIKLYGFESGWHHFTNVLLHAANAMLLFAVLRRATNARWRSAFVALLFAIHPLHVEAVAWISERREVLSGLFWLIAIWFYFDYVKNRRTFIYVLLLAAFAGGLMSKPMIVTLPFALFLLDYWPLRRLSPATIVEKIPLFALALAGSVVTFIVQRHGGATASLGDFPFPIRVENAIVSYGAYAIQFLWPANLAVLYPYSGEIAGRAALAAVMLLAITAWVIAQRRARPYLFTGWFWFGGTLIPVIGLVQVGVQSRADRYMYIPLIGLGIMLAWGLAEFAGRAAPILAIAACCAYAIVAWQTTGYWSSTVTLFRHAVEVTTDNWAALNVLSDALLNENRPRDAMPYIAETLRMRPNLPEARVNFAAALSKQGDFDGAAAQYRAALKLEPDNPDAQEGLGVVLTEQGQYAEALTNLVAAAKLQPADADAHYNLGRLYGLSGRPDLAAGEFIESVRLQPKNAAAHFNLGASYAAQEKFEPAIGEFNEALRLKPDYIAARFNLGSSLASLQRYDDAIAQFQEILRVQPDFEPASESLKKCMALKRQSK